MQDPSSPPARLAVRRLNRILSGLLAVMRDLSDRDRELPVRWSIMHMYSSSQLAKLLAMRRGLDPELAGIAAALHDLGTVMTGRRADHAAVAETHIREFLARYHRDLAAGLPPITDEELSRILEAVARHSEKGVTSDDSLAELLKDADALDGYLHGLPTGGARLERCRRTMQELGIAFPHAAGEEVERTPS
ncbi:MAG: HD domain-containing protein [Armatimonadota bacterium]|nr:HD domain-containing protein [Armatimonadota bacterium]